MNTTAYTWSDIITAADRTRAELGSLQVRLCCTTDASERYLLQEAISDLRQRLERLRLD